MHPTLPLKRGANMATRSFGPNRNTFSLANLDWHGGFNDDTLEHFRNPKVLPALMTLINQIQLIRTEGGLVSTTLTLDLLKERVQDCDFRFDCGTIVDSNTFGRILEFIRFAPRGKILGSGSQNVGANARYAGNIPLFMSVFKDLRGVKYSAWDLTDPKLAVVVDKYNYEVLEYVGGSFDWTATEFLELGTLMRTQKGGKTPGRVEPASSYSKRVTGDNDFDALPIHVKMLLTQLWLYQPSINNPLAIRNLHDIDAAAEPLINIDMFVQVPKTSSPKGDSTW